MAGTDFSPEQQQFLKGFMAGVEARRGSLAPAGGGGGGAPPDAMRAAQDAAVASLGDADELARRRAFNAEARAHLVGLCAGLDLALAPQPVGNFVYAEVGEDARPVFDALLREGVIVRPLAGFGAPGAIRVTVGTTEENELFAQALRRVRALA